MEVRMPFANECVSAERAYSHTQADKHKYQLNLFKAYTICCTLFCVCRVSLAYLPIDRLIAAHWWYAHTHTSHKRDSNAIKYSYFEMKISLFMHHDDGGVTFSSSYFFHAHSFFFIFISFVIFSVHILPEVYLQFAIDGKDDSIVYYK